MSATKAPRTAEPAADGGFAGDPFRLTLRLVRQRTWLFVVDCLAWGFIHALPVLLGLFMRSLFDALGNGAAAGASPWAFLALALAVDATRLASLAGGVYGWASYWLEITLHLRRNVLRHLLMAPGSRRLPDSPSEAVTRFRDDVNDIGEYVENWVDFWGLAAFAVVALSIMLAVNPLMTALVCLPLSLTLVLTGLLRPTIRRARRASREATSRVTDFLGETFGSVQAVMASGREASVLRRFEGLNETRRRAALRDSLLTELFRSVTDNMVNVATGIVLLLASGAVHAGRFSVGDFALFVSYLPRLTSIMSFLGLMVVQHRRTGVAYERLGRLMVDAPVGELLRSEELELEREVPPFRERRPRAEPFRVLQARALTYRHPGQRVAAGAAGGGIQGVDLELRRGEFVVITGRVGSGKTTLLRTLLGLLPAQAGEIRVNGEVVDDPATFFVPPRSAYASQVPRLFSDSLRENVLMGRSVNGEALDAALALAVLERDVAGLDEGLETEVGTRGVKLSGGQVQRAAAARMFLREAELLVFDDLSSALDVETERRLWDGLFASRAATCLVVSHRRAALERADRILVLEEGRVAASGTLSAVLAASGELRELWGGGAAPPTDPPGGRAVPAPL